MSKVFCFCRKKKTPEDCEPEVIVISAPTVAEVSEADQDQVKRAKSQTDPRTIYEQSPSTEDVAEETTLPSSATEESVTVAEDCEQGTLLPDVPATSTSAPTEAPKKKKASWWRRLFRLKKKKKKNQTLVKVDVADTDVPLSIKEPEGDGACVQEASSTPNTPISLATEQQAETIDVEEKTNLPSLATEPKEPEGDGACVLEASSTLDTPVSASTELRAETEDVEEKTNLPSLATEPKEPEGDGACVLEASSTLEAPVSASTELRAETEDAAQSVSSSTEAPKKKAKKACWWRRLFGLEKKKMKNKQETQLKVDVAEDTDVPLSSTEDNSNSTLSHSGEDDGAKGSPPSDSKVSDWSKSENNLPVCKPVSGSATPAGHGGNPQAILVDTDLLLAKVVQLLRSDSKELLLSTDNRDKTEPLSREELLCLGFPNLANTCYMNSTLQALLTLAPFMQEVHKQEKVWSSHPRCEIFSGLVKVGVCHFSNVKKEKKAVLKAFKKTVSGSYREFKDNDQKDAHEFLISVLDMMRSLSEDLHAAAVSMGLTYTCPVDASISFQMLSTRTCMGCGLQSEREESYLNLCLDLVAGGSVSDCVQEYLKANQLEFTCDICSTKESSQQWSFKTLPNVLVLQLQRFSYDASFNLRKVDSPVIISRELFLIPGCADGEQTRYCLVSIVNHIGFTTYSGHYICDGAHQKPGDKKDRWLTFDDDHVSETTLQSVCHQRQRSAYILFYQKQM